jgi:hypothetical protein
MPVIDQIKQTGATFTPPILADFLAGRLAANLSKVDDIQVLDPSCGEGELLVSMSNILENKKIAHSLTGYDTNVNYLSNTELRLKESASTQVTLVADDFLSVVDLTKDQLALDFVDKANDTISNSIDVVIANPPYVRTQVLGTERAQTLAKKFDLKGRVDLYYPFLMAMTEALKEGGIVGVITSNRYLFTKSGKSIRDYLNANYDIIEVIDLGDTKLFDAAVLPAIFIGRKKKKNAVRGGKARFSKIYEELNGYDGKLYSAEHVIEVLNTKESGFFKIGDKKYKKTSGWLSYDGSKSNQWQLLSDEEAKWVDQIRSNASSSVGDLFKVRVGIKTTADKVFISDQWDNQPMNGPEKELLKPLISQENIQAWSVSDELKLKVLYTHYSDGQQKKKVIDLADYPKAEKYLLANEERLKGRKYVIKAGRKWYEIWVPQQPHLWSKPKIVFPDISVCPRFCFDTTGKLVNGNCYWIVAEEEKAIEKLLLVQGIANSKLMTKYHDLVFNNKLYSGRRRYFSQYVERYPLPDLNSEAAKEIVQIADQLNKSIAQKEMVDLENELELVVAKAFKVDPVFNLD